MNSLLRISAVALLSLGLGSTVSAPSTVAAPAEPLTVDSAPYSVSKEVRIKRMHLARPDLMGYPSLQDYYA